MKVFGGTSYEVANNVYNMFYDLSNKYETKQRVTMGDWRLNAAINMTILARHT